MPEISGAENSRTAEMAASRLSIEGLSFILRLIPSTITMAESTKIPIPRIREKRLRKLIVLPERYRPINPNRKDKGMAVPASKPSRQPMVKISKSTTKVTVCSPDEDNRIRSLLMSLPASSTVTVVRPSSSSPGFFNSSKRSFTAAVIVVMSPPDCL